MDPALYRQLDFTKVGAILADMVVSISPAGTPPSDPEGADDNELQDCRPTPIEAGLHLRPPVDAGASALQSGEHGSPIQLGGQSPNARLEPKTMIRVLDRDLGKSGAAASTRTDFKALVGDVAMGHVGAIFSLEASRLARSNQDWHRLLELCAITGTLVIDEDGVYAPCRIQRRPRAGMKGTFAQAELHIIRARLHGGKLNKASRGELRFALPVGLIFEEDKIVLDPDRGSTQARFARSSNCSLARARPTVSFSASRSLVYASRVIAYGGAWKRQIALGPSDPLARARHLSQSLLCWHLRVRPLPILEAGGGLR